MKIGILTLPLNINYGGILQAYALKCVLESNGHDVKFIQSDIFPSDVPKRFSVKRRALVYPKRFVMKYFLKKNISVRPDYDIVKKYCFIARNIQPFIDQHIQYIDLQNILKNKTKCLDAIIVGSDQVWRREFTGPTIVDYFLGFLNTNEVKRIAYAASFGSEKWEFTDSETKKCAELAKKFDLITVRENLGVYFCQKYLQVAATHVLDPTMLLDKESYINLVNQASENKSDGNLFYYILDDKPEKKAFVDNIATALDLVPFTQMPELKTSTKSYLPFDYDERYCYSSVTSWLRSFIDAKFVVTDSFHGCVFSIIFNKPFYVIANKERGMARFNSLLKLFNLESRMIDVAGTPNITCEAIDWDNVNRIKEKYAKLSMLLLLNSLH